MSYGTPCGIFVMEKKTMKLIYVTYHHPFGWIELEDGTVVNSKQFKKDYDLLIVGIIKLPFIYVWKAFKWIMNLFITGA